MQSDPVPARLTLALQVPVGEYHPLAPETTFQIGGPARYFCAPDSAETLRAVVLAARELGLPYFVLGGGSNVLFRDEGFPGLVVSLKNLDHMLLNPQGGLRVGAGLANAVLTEETLRHGLTGFEWAAGLPGTVGGGVFMNAKCYGGAYGDVVAGVRALNPADGAWLHLSQADCKFAYKDSVFQHQGWIIADVSLELAPGDPAEIRAVSEANLADRNAKGQFTYPSAGCVFKNNYSVGISSGRLIEESGLKGVREGGGQVYERHANFIVNTGGATAAEVLALIERVKKTVWDTRQVRLEEELRVVG